MNRIRNFVFTLNNYTCEEVSTINALTSENSPVKYLIYGKEIGEGGTEHLQGYAELSKQQSLKQVKKLLSSRIHVEKRKGSAKQAITYCQKDDKTPYIYGVSKNQGKRTDLAEIRELVKKGTKLTVIIDNIENLNYQNIKGAQLLKSIYSVKRKEKPIIIWLYGSTGIGKTRYVYDTYADIYTSGNGKWFDGYEQNNVILVDDYRCDYMKFHTLLRFIDRYPFTRELKGSTIHINSKFIIFTSPKNPLEMWEHRTAEDIKQLIRRIDYLIDYDLINEIQNYGKKIDV